MSDTNPRDGFQSPMDHYVRAMPSLSIARIADAWGIPHSTAKSQAEREGWARARAQFRLRVETAVQEAEVRGAVDHIVAMNERHRQLAGAVTMEVGQTLKVAQKIRQVDPDHVLDARMIDKLASALLKAQNVERTALGLQGTPAPAPEAPDATKALLATIFDAGSEDQKQKLREAAIALHLAQTQGVLPEPPKDDN
jgi:hypothetical protein